MIDKYSQEIEYIEYDNRRVGKPLKDAMWDNVGILRDEYSLKRAEEKLKESSPNFLSQANATQNRNTSFKI